MNIIIEGKHNQSVPVTFKGKPILIRAGETIYTDHIICTDHDEKGLSYKLNSEGVPSVSIYMEECHVEPKDNEEDERCVVAENGKKIASGLIDKAQHHCRINPLPLKCFRFKIEQESTTAPETEVELIISLK